MAETVLERTLGGRDHWAILVFCGGGVGEQVTHALLPWQAHWQATNPATAYALAAGLINGARQLGAGWRAFAAVDGRSGQVMSGPQMIGAMGMLRAIELGVLPSVTRDPPGPFDVGWPETASLRPPEADIGNIDAGEEPLILLFAQGACAEHVGTVCLPWDDEMARPGREGALCRQIGQVWNKLPKDWRFACAVSGRNGRILATPALMGQIGALGGMERNTAEKAAAR